MEDRYKMKEIMHISDLSCWCSHSTAAFGWDLEFHVQVNKLRGCLKHTDSGNKVRKNLKGICK